MGVPFGAPTMPSGTALTKHWSALMSVLGILRYGHSDASLACCGRQAAEPCICRRDLASRTVTRWLGTT